MPAIRRTWSAGCSSAARRSGSPSRRRSTPCWPAWSAVTTLDAIARARCTLQGGPACRSSRAATRAAPGPGGGFIDSLATVRHQHHGAVDTISVWATTAEPRPARPSPGPAVRAVRTGREGQQRERLPWLRGARRPELRVDHVPRLLQRRHSGITRADPQGQGGRLPAHRLPGPAFPPVTNPADPNDQIARPLGNDTAMVIGNFDEVFAVGDRLLLAVYNGTVMQIPDFSITPPSAITLPTTTSSPENGPNFTVSPQRRVQQHGDAPPARRCRGHAVGHPEWDILPDPAGHAPGRRRHEPADVVHRRLHPGQERDHGRHQRHPDQCGAGRDLHGLAGRATRATRTSRRAVCRCRPRSAAPRATSAWPTRRQRLHRRHGRHGRHPDYVSTTNASRSWGAGGSAVTLGVDAGSFTDCSLDPATIGAGQLTLSASAVTPPRPAMGRCRR